MSARDVADEAFMLRKAPQTIEHLVVNLRSLGDAHPNPLPHLRSVYGRDVVICGAGPTLDLERVKAAADAGATIWTVNTAARAVCSVVSPDVVVVRESLDVSSHLDGMTHAPGLVAVDLCAHPNVWERARRMGPAAFFVPASLQSFGVAEALDVEPLYAGTSSLTAAVALADHGGAASITLEGVDLAYHVSGRGYSEHAQYQAGISRVVGAIATPTGGDEQRALAERSGQEHHSGPQRVTIVHARGGGYAHTLGTWLSQIEWLEEYARRRPYDRVGWGQEGFPFRHRGLGLAALDGWGDEPAPFFVPGHVDADVRRIAPERVELAVADIERQCLLARAVAHEVTGGGDVAGVPGIGGGYVLVDSHSAGQQLLAQRRQHVGMADRVAATYAPVIASAERLSG